MPQFEEAWKMKKAVVVSVLLLLLLLPLAASPAQKYYPVASDEWQTVNAICHWAGVSGPTSNGPVTALQLLAALERAERYIDGENAVLENIKAVLDEEDSFYSDDLGSISLNGELSPEMYVQTSRPYDTLPADAWNRDSDWFLRSHSERESLFSLILENTIKDNFYGRLRFSFRQKSNPEDENIWNKNLHFSFVGNVINQNFPFDGGVSLGSGGLSLIVARSRVSLGEGYTGNTAIGDNYDYQDFMKAGFYTKSSSVFLTLTTFDSSHGSDISSPWDVRVSSFSGWKNIRHSASYEIVLVDRLKLSLAFVTLLDTTASFDIRYLNPFIFLHNMYNFHESGESHKYSTLEANNMITLDLSWTLAKKWNMYIQVTMDQLQLPGESDEYIHDFDYTEPNTFGGLFNISYSDIIKGSGILNLYGEVVYNMAGMYLNSKYYDSEGNVVQTAGGSRCWSQDYLVGYHRELESADDVAYSGYKYGPDSVVVSFGGTYRVPYGFAVSASLFYMAHGEKGRGTNPSNYTFDGIDDTANVNRLPLYGTIEHTLVAKAEGEIQLLSFLSISGGLAYSYRWNFRNNSGLTFSNLQGYFGIKLSTASFSV